MVGQADKWCNAPSFLVHVEQKFGNIPKHGMLNSLDVSPVVTIIVVGTDTDCSRQTVKNLVGKVDLSAIDVLFALHLRIQLVLVGCESVGGKHALQEYIEHGHTFLVLNEAAATDNAYHGRDGPTVLLVGCEEGWYNGGRGLAFILMFANTCDIGIDVAELPGFLEV